MTSSGLTGKLTIKKRILFHSSFFRKFFTIFLVFLIQLETSNFSCPGSVNDKPHVQSNEAR